MYLTHNTLSASRNRLAKAEGVKLKDLLTQRANAGK